MVFLYRTQARNIVTRDNPLVNPGGRGYQNSVRYSLGNIEDGGDYRTRVAGLAEVPQACSYEENELMLAEVKIRRGEIDAALAHVDNVRSHQEAGLPTVEGTGLTSDEALEELRIERRIGLFLKNVSFYDARRWGVLKPISEGGGRKNAVVVFDGGVAEECTIEYLYKEWWDVPPNETDFNPMNPSTASEPNSLSGVASAPF